MSRILKSIANGVGAFLLLFCSFSYSNAQVITGAGQPPIIERQFYDDTYVHVPLQFGFPFYGRTFTNSWMHSNGVVSFLDPAVPVPGAGYNPGQWAYCCQGIQPSATRPEFSFMIAPLWTDLYPVGQSRFMTQGDATFQRYYWENIAEISNMNNLNTFGLEIRPSGFIGAYYDKVNIQNQQTWSGIIGDPTLNQWTQQFYGIPGLNANLTTFPNWFVNNTPGDVCASNPLSSPTCPGYTEAMCSSNALYSPSCAGYQQAYFTQQCSINSLYNVNCPGYASAYLQYQCSVNPLYSTTCEGYEQAYFTQQCTANSLYNSSCPGYAQAYFTQQCTLDGLYSRDCPNYSTAYATKMVLERQGTASIVATAGVIAQTSPAPTTSISSDGTVKSEVSKTGDSNVDNAISSPTTTANSAAAPAAPVQLSQPSNNQQAAVAVERKQEKQEERKDASGTSSSSSSNNQNTSPSSDKKDNQPKTARQELQERRVAAAKAEAVEKGKNLADDVGKAASLEQQVAVQNVVIAAMGYTPGFDAYGKTFIPDTVGYKPFTIYNNQRTVDSRSASRMFGATDNLHQQMIDTQYGR